MASSSSCVLPVGINMEKMQQISKLVNGDDNPFKCAVCKHYLSISPIVHNDVLGSICGRDLCKKLAASQGTNYRQSAYEGLAKVFEFPCMYEESGCKEVLPWNEIGEHELICEFMKLCCPFSTDQFEDEEKICTWEGNTSEILGHMEEVHSPHRFENYVQISIEQDMKRNKLLFSRIQDSIVILLVIVGAESETYWKAWTGPEIWKNFNYKIEISSEKGQSLTVSKFQKAELLHPTFFKSKIDNSWFKINVDSIKNLFDSPYFLTTKFYVKGFLIGSPENLSCHDINSLLPMPTITCRNHNCENQAEKFIYVCRSNKDHKFCNKCGSVKCPFCNARHVFSGLVRTTMKVLFKVSFEFCILCKENVQCLSAHLSNCHNEFIFNLGEYNNFRLKYHFFSFDDHIFLLSKKIEENRDRTFSVICLGFHTVTYKYELKLVTTKPSYSAITFTNFCYAGLINYLNYTIGENYNSCIYETLIPETLYNSIFPFGDNEDNIKFKLNIFKI
ncbi:uncharacterized protein LOC123308772 [Coccinella septempunctata]|uniref:uncharacterized protein LOC123308772 n=1 Tax=Coccinella septempunctata TaxID=41139 RepID=UPI001D097E8B|nr:uncharacterized protein LOC123308772 [Coccinella septempunctata]